MNKASYQYSCEICSQKFGRKSALSKHTRMHEVEQQQPIYAKRTTNTIPCDQCDKLFKTATTLKKHKNEKHVNTNDVIDGLVTDAPVKNTQAQAMNGSEEFILIDSSLDDECINEIGEPVIKPSKREARNKKTAEDTTHDKNKSDVHNDGSNASTSSMSSRSSDIQDSADLACLPNEAKETDNSMDTNNRFENESTSASMRLSLSASEDEAEEPSLCLNNLFDEKPITTEEPVASYTQVNKEGDQEVSNLNIVNDEEDQTESRDESDSQSVDSLDRPNKLKRKRSPDDDVDEAQENEHQELDDSSMAKSSCKKTRLDESASQQSKSYLGKCIIL